MTPEQFREALVQLARSQAEAWERFASEAGFRPAAPAPQAPPPLSSPAPEAPPPQQQGAPQAEPPGGLLESKRRAKKKQNWEENRP